MFSGCSSSFAWCFSGSRRTKVDPSPGVLAPLKLPAPRRLELWFQKQHGVRIPLHALDSDPEDVVRSIERYRPVMVETY